MKKIKADIKAKSESKYKKIPVYDPKTGEKIDEIIETPVKEIKNIFQKLTEGQKEWASYGLKRRKIKILKIKESILVNIDEIVNLISKDTGKSKTDVIMSEIYPVISTIDTFVKRAERYLSDKEINLKNKLTINKKSYVAYMPKGPVAVISPWNYPFQIPFREIILNLLAGNSVLLKGSPETLLVSLKIEEIIRFAGIDDNIFQNVLGGKEAGEEITKYPWKHITFTGSVEVGKRIMAKAAENLTSVTLELGGKDPMIVLEDADLERAANGAIFNGCFISGQSCAAVERIYVSNKVKEKFIKMLVDKAKKLRSYIEYPSDYDIGPITTKFQYDKILAHLREASKKAKILTGGLPQKGLAGWYIPPTVVVNVNHSMKLMKEETFGPILPVMGVSSIQEAIDLANDSDYGLNASIWTKNHSLAKKIASKLEAGTVLINDHLYTQAVSRAPWLGIKKSGIGVSHGAWGPRSMAQLKHINYDVLPLKRDLWWFPSSANKYDAFKSYIKKDFWRKPAIMLKFIKEFLLLFRKF
ncbi:MAG: aldehyde dehydrogenase family protein [Spirochaetia bacterium]|nr:aldehyde dehydrogenase family protein [Spirochaetia bacterium]